MNLPSANEVGDDGITNTVEGSPEMEKLMAGASNPIGR
jgi:hypothetical protein